MIRGWSQAGINYEPVENIPDMEIISLTPATRADKSELVAGFSAGVTFVKLIFSISGIFPTGS